MYELFREHLTQLLATIMVGMTAATAAFFKKLPQHYFETKQKTQVEKMQQLDIILDDLVDETGAIYGHIINYHDGHKELLAGDKWRMTVTWESLGKPCVSCTNTCEFRELGGRKRLQEEWQDVHVTSGWFKTVSKAYLDKSTYHLTSVTDKKIGKEELEIFQRSGIHTFVEILIKVKNKTFYTLGLSFCKKYEEEGRYIAIIPAGKRLAKLL